MNFITNNDLKVGMVLTVQNGAKYVVVADDNGHHDVICLSGCTLGKSNGIEVGNGQFAVVGGVNGSRDIVKVQAFDAVPTRNRLSEALKFMTGKRFTENLIAVWEKEDERVRMAKDKLESAKKAYLMAEEAYFKTL